MPKLTREQVKAREQELFAYWKSQQRRVQEFFPSSEAGGRGAVSPLGGTAVPAKQQPRKR